MSEPSGDLNEAWNHVVEELLGKAGAPGTGIPAFTHTQRAYLQLAWPVLLVDSYVVLTTPHAEAKQVIEQELGDYIRDALARLTGHPCVLAVTVQQASPPQASSPAASSPAHQPEPQPESWNTSYPEPTPPAPPTPSDPPTSQGSPSQEGTPNFHEPMSLDELAAQYARQQAEHMKPKEEPDSAHHPQRLARETPAHDPNRETSLNPKYTFDTFVIGSSNRFANGAAVAVAENPARAYNPLFIWGGSGLGKTHLLHAAGNYAKLLQPDLRVKYVSSEEFTNDYINSVRDDMQESFKKRYRNLDVLMVDDIQFLQGKEGTQEEFFHTFNALHQANKQIILSSDRPPRQLTTLEDRLRTRFEGGLITDVQPPDLETRIAILEKKAATDGTQVDRQVLEFIASRFESSIRELEGALIRLSAYSSLTREPITIEVANSALHDIMPENAVNITPATIKQVTCDYFDIPMDALTGTSKTRAVTLPRQLAMYLCRELTDLSLPKIGAEFGGRDHTTVMYAERKIRKEMTENRDTYDQIQALTQQIKNTR